MAKRVPAAPITAPAGEVPAERLQVTFGHNFRVRRLEAGLTQKAVADAAKMHVPDVSVIESGGGNVTLKTMERLARVVDCRVEVLLIRADLD